MPREWRTTLLLKTFRFLSGDVCWEAGIFPKTYHPKKVSWNYWVGGFKGYDKPLPWYIGDEKLPS